ncbi:hypothetical protein M3Y99_01942900 [Aphelenchoides fujianensis]|nr:hypothetical protein M3Y99_01942900 [Aphelenchoides fujianensis]
MSDDSNSWASGDESDGDVDEASGPRAGVPTVEQPVDEEQPADDEPNPFAAEYFDDVYGRQFELEDAEEDSTAGVRPALAFPSPEQLEEASAGVEEEEAAAPLPPAERPPPSDRMGGRVDKIHRLLLARHPQLAAVFAQNMRALLDKAAGRCE